MRNDFLVRKLCITGMLGALSIGLALTLRFPIFAAAPYLEFDGGDVPILIATLLYGPWTGLVVAVLKALVQGFTVSAQSGVWGMVMNVISSGTFCLCAGLVHRLRRTRGGALLGLWCGALLTTLVMIPANLLITPLYSGMPREAVAQMLLPILIPFNLIKCAITAAAVSLLYLPLKKLTIKWWGESDVY